MLEDTPVWRTYIADGVQKQWDFDLPYIDGSSIKLYISHEGVLKEIEASLFTFDEETKKITYPIDASPAVPQGDIVLIWRQTEVTQEEDSTHMAFKSSDIEYMVDKLTAICQELKDAQNRSISFDPTESPVGEDTNAAEYIALLQNYKDVALTSSENAAKSEANAKESEIIASKAKESALNSASIASASEGKSLQYKNEAAVSAETAIENANKFITLPIGSVYFSFSNRDNDNPASFPGWLGKKIDAANEFCPSLWEYVLANPQIQTSQSNYDSMVNKTGSCPLFVIDTSAKTLVLPKINSYIRASSSVPTAGIDTMRKITGSCGTFGGENRGDIAPGGGTGALWRETGVHKNTGKDWAGGAGIKSVNIDTSRLGENYSGEETEPKHITMYPWIVYRDTVENLISHNGGTIAIRTFTAEEWLALEAKPTNTLCLIEEEV